jgi:uncharacterized protein YndB with AHSA1/START domain
MPKQGEPTLRLERVLPADRSAVFEAFSDPDQVAKWWGPQGFAVSSIDFDPRVGGSYRIQMQPPEGDPFHLSGEFREVDSPANLAYTFAWDPADADDVETLVDLSFHDADGSTEVVLLQGPFKTEARLDLHRDGWSESFDKLEEVLSER